MAIGLQVWSKTPASNATADSNINFAEGQAPSSLNDSCRALMASAASWRDDNNGTLVTAGTSIAATITTNQAEAALTAGYTVRCQIGATLDSSATLNVDSLGAKPIQIVAGTNIAYNLLQAGAIQSFTYSTTGTGQWIIQGGVAPSVSTTSTAPIGTFLTNSIAGDVSLNNTGTYFDGPSVTQGSSGTWLVSGTVTCLDSGVPANFQAKLWDGTTVIASAEAISAFASGNTVIPLSGALASPAGNLKISVKDVTSTSGAIKANSSGNAKDSTITAVRIA